MNKIGMLLGAAAIMTLSGCKDPDYKYETAPDSQNDVKVIGEAPSAEVKPLEVKPIEAKPIEVTPIAEKPVAPIPPETIKPAPAPAPVAAKPAGSENTTYVVKSGDSLSKISKRHNVTISSIRRLNPSLRGDMIRIGQKIVLPGKLDVGAQAPVAPAHAAKRIVSGPFTGAVREYVVKSGDSLGAIAHGKGISVRQLKEMNGLKKDVIRVGQKLKVPAEKVTAKASVQAGRKAKKASESAVRKVEVKKAEVKAEKKAEGKPAEAAPAAPAEETVAPAEKPQDAAPAQTEEKPAETVRQEPSKTPTYTVQEGDDMTGVSIRWGVSAAAIRDLNNLGENDQLKPGQVIKLPAEAQQ